jgi:hypothetical protein
MANASLRSHLGIAGRLALVLVIAGCGGGSYSQRPVLGAHDKFASTPYKSAASPVVGKTLSTDNGSWSRAVSSYAYQWEDCTGVATGAKTGWSNASGSPSNDRLYGGGRERERLFGCWLP